MTKTKGAFTSDNALLKLVYLVVQNISGKWAMPLHNWNQTLSQLFIILGYKLKGTKIPNFFTIEDPKPYYTGHPSDNFLNPYIFEYLSGLEQNNFPYDMSILTWAMSDNAPIDPELPDAVKAWNGH